MANTVGWNPDIEARVRALSANVTTEGGLIARTCEHGVRHPVGHLDDAKWRDMLAMRAQDKGELANHRNRCCRLRCCETWESARSVDAVDPVGEKVTG